ncbi:hypothetical protein ACJJTC_002156 [Scirpophaga incertulas]
MEFSSSGGMRSPFSPRVRQSITGRKPLGGISSRKNQGNYTDSPESQNGEVIYKTASATIETFGPPLPVMVTEMLTFGAGEVTARVSACGWAWVVGGRRAVCWPRAGPARCLPLPQTDLQHKADLLEMYFEDGAQMPSCVSVSPEGVVRYWPSVGHEAASVDSGCGLAGQEGDRLRAAGRRLLLATTSGALLLLYPRVRQGRMTVTSRVLRPPSGWLGGIGRRVSNLFFGAVPPSTDTKLVNMVVLKEGALEANVPEEEEGEPEGCVVVVASGGAAGGPLLTAWAPRPADHCLRRALHDPRIVKVNVSGAALRVCSVTGVRWAGGVPRLLPLRGAALLYCPTQLALLPVGGVGVSGGVVEGDTLELGAAGDRLLCAALVPPAPPLLLSRAHGLLALHALAPAPTICDSPLGSPCPSDLYDGNLSFYEIDPNEVRPLAGDAAGQLRLAFLHHARRELGAARALLDAAFPPPAWPSADLDAPLDLAVRAVAAALLDDPPAGDPRSVPALAFLHHARRELGAARALLDAAFPPPAWPSADLDAPLDLAVRAVAAALLDDPPAGDPRSVPALAFLHHARRELGAARALLDAAFPPPAWPSADLDAPLDLAVRAVAAALLDDPPAGDPRSVSVPALAFLHHARRELGAARALLDAAFPPPAWPSADLDAPLDLAVRAVAAALLDDPPAGDPRSVSVPALAFLHHARRELGAARALLDAAFPPPAWPSADLDAPLDLAVRAVAAALLDDPPAGDPRSVPALAFLHHARRELGAARALLDAAFPPPAWPSADLDAPLDLAVRAVAAALLDDPPAGDPRSVPALAFLHHARRELGAARALLDAAFPPPAWPSADLDAPLDLAVRAVAAALLDDPPAGDPRSVSVPALAFLHHARRELGAARALLDAAFPPPAWPSADLDAPLDLAVRAVAAALLDDPPAGDPRSVSVPALAFLHHARRELGAARALLDAAFPPPAWPSADLDAPLDLAVRAVAAALLDDPPAGDPRSVPALAFLHHARRELGAARALLDAAFPPPAWPSADLDAPLDLAVRAVAAALLDDPPAGDPRSVPALAFLHHARRELGAARALLDAAFPPPAWPSADLDAPLDLAVRAVAAALLDDPPAGDPRSVPALAFLHHARRELGAARALLDAAFPPPAWPSADLDAPLDLAVRAVAAALLDDPPAGDPRSVPALAFLHHARRELGAARALLDAAFPPPAWPSADLDAPLDLAVRAVAAALLDDPPAGDPRWKCGSAGGGTALPLGSSAALQHGAQLADKQRALAALRDLLLVHGLQPRLRRLTAVYCAGGEGGEGAEGGEESVPTLWELGELAARLAAARALRPLLDCGPLLPHAVHLCQGWFIVGH